MRSSVALRTGGPDRALSTCGTNQTLAACASLCSRWADRTLSARGSDLTLCTCAALQSRRTQQSLSARGSLCTGRTDQALNSCGPDGPLGSRRSLRPRGANRALSSCAALSACRTGAALRACAALQAGGTRWTNKPLNPRGTDQALRPGVALRSRGARNSLCARVACRTCRASRAGIAVDGKEGIRRRKDWLPRIERGVCPRAARAADLDLQPPAIAIERACSEVEIDGEQSTDEIGPCDCQCRADLSSPGVRVPQRKQNVRVARDGRSGLLELALIRESLARRRLRGGRASGQRQTTGSTETLDGTRQRSVVHSEDSGRDWRHLS